MARITPWVRGFGRLVGLLLGGWVATGCGGGPELVDPLERAVAGMGVHEQAAHTIAAQLRLEADSVAPDLRAQIATGSAGAVVLTGSADDAMALTALQGLRASAPWPLLAVAALDAADAIEPASRAAPLLGLAAFPSLRPGEPRDPHQLDAERTTSRLAEYLDSARAAGLVMGVELLPMQDSALPPLLWDRRRLEAVELREISALVKDEAAPEALLLSAVRIPALSGDTMPLPLAPAAVSGWLRRDLRYEGVVAADVKDAASQAGMGVEEAAIALLANGVDLLVGIEQPAAAADAIVDAVESGVLARERLREAALRVLRLRSGAVAAAAAVAADTAAAPPSIRARFAAVRAAPSDDAESRPDSTMPAPLLREVEPDSVGMNPALAGIIDEIMRDALEDSVFTGAAVVVGRRGGIVLERGYGSSDRQGAMHPVTPTRTIFDLASLTKVIGTTTAVALLMESGEMQLDNRVRQYLPEFSGDGREDIRIHHLLTHSSGLPSGLWLFGGARSAEDALEKVLEAPMRRDPGERVQYSDLGMILLAEVVERVAGVPLDVFLAERVFSPLGMDATMYLPPLAFRAAIVPTAETTERNFPLQGIVHDANAFRLEGVTGHAGLFSTVRDVAVFAQMMLNGGSYGPARILSPETVAEFTRSRSDLDDRALGWDTPGRVSSAGAYFSARSFGHTGYTGTSLWIDPEADLFVVLLTNRTYSGATPRQILDLRVDVHEAAAQAVTDQPVRRRPGAVRR